MTRHLIVTCGTSQILNEKIDQLRVPYLDAVFKELQEAPETGNQLNLERMQNEEGFETLTKSLLDAWLELPGLIGTDVNYFGAELSTLEKMRTTQEPERQRPAFVPKEDTLTILWSDTKAGCFCAAVLRHVLLRSSWNMTAGQIQTRPVPDLRERPPNAVVADKNLYEAVAQSHRRGVLGDAIVFTGGFKSSIPTLSIFAILHHMSLYCLFERSDRLHRIQLPDQVYQQLQPCLDKVVTLVDPNPGIVYGGAT